jgi:hypothetical protein
MRVCVRLGNRSSWLSAVAVNRVHIPELHAEAFLYILKRDAFAAQSFLMGPLKLLSRFWADEKVFFNFAKRLHGFFLRIFRPNFTRVLS